MGIEGIFAFSFSFFKDPLGRSAGERIFRAAAVGAGAGTVATLAMSSLMLAAKAAGLLGSLPPEKITAYLLDRAGIRQSRKTQFVLASFNHFVFGAGGGAVFGVAHLVLPRTLSLPLGLAFGSGIWALSYGGWIPALGIMPPPSRDRPGRPPAMLAAHLVYGGVLGAIFSHIPGLDPAVKMRGSVGGRPEQLSNESDRRRL